MLLRKEQLDGIASGAIDRAFRRWRRPTVKTGGTLRTHVGVLRIDTVDEVQLADITERDAARAGYASRTALLAELDRREGRLYRIAFGLAGPDPRVALREEPLRTPADIERVQAALLRLDRASTSGPWTRATLALIAKRPGVRAPDLAVQFALEVPRFKARVRKLKELGLTHSLEVGYELSVRGESLLEHEQRTG
jgi:hypothetical protein